VEGGFYTWDCDEVLKPLGENWAKVFVHRAKRVEAGDREGDGRA